ncbi:hypothetical protein [Hyphomicrobium sp.]|uniref:hypothetical protein n=1 Tax=Hyphomicrobium sp. TaxID=82 RepID=UPI002E3702E1|nr:hypothetical protein [Hyphomicrobium sp.]HEX2840842.1 hypothetical protein [Hyphomicrobium sp.]
MLQAKTEDVSEAAPAEVRATYCLAALSRSHWLSTRMSAKAVPLFQPIPVEDLPTPVEAAEEIAAVEASEPVDQSATSESDNDNSLPTALALAEGIDGKPAEPAASAPSSARGFGPGALFVSALAGAATAVAAILTFGISHGRWERAIDFQAYADVIEPRTAELETFPISFAEAAIAYETAETEIPGVLATRPVNAPVAGDDLEGPSEGMINDKEEVTDFSSLNLGTPFVPGDTSVAGTAVVSPSPILAGLDTPAAQDVPSETVEAVTDFSSWSLGTPFVSGDTSVAGTAVASASSILADLDGPAAGSVPSEEETVAQAASFGSYQMAGLFQASDSPSAGAVLSDGSGVMGASPVPASGKIVVGRVSTGMGKATDAETTVVSIPAGAKKVDAVLHVITTDGRLAQISKLSVVVGDKIRAMPDRPVRKSAQRKTSAPAVRAVDAAKLANRKAQYRPHVSPPPPPAILPPRGLFNFGSTYGLKKDGFADGSKGGAAG